MQKTVRVLALAGGLCAALTGLLAGLAAIGAAFFAGPDTRQAVVLMAASVSLFGLMLGGALAWQGWHSMDGRPSARWVPRRTWIAVLAVAAAIALGGWSLGRSPLDLVLLPGAHLLATALPPAIILALVARSLGGPALRRHVVAQVSSGAFLSVLLAMAAETILVLGLVAVVVVAAQLVPGGQAWLEGLSLALETAAVTQDPGRIPAIVDSPWLWVAALAVASAGIPLIEESVKTVGVGLMLYRRPARHEAYLWGAAGGAGFAMVESAGNSLLGLQSWATAVLVRIPAGLMHCFTGALMGLAWHAVFIERRRGHAAGLFFACVALHGTWNALAVSLSLLGRGETATFLAGEGAGLFGLLLLAMAAAVAIAFATVTQRVRRAEIAPDRLQEPAAGEPAAAREDASPDEPPAPEVVVVGPEQPVPPAGQP